MPSPLEIEFQHLIESLNEAQEPTFTMILELLYRTRFSGAITLHCSNGIPRQADFGRPVRIDLTRSHRRGAEVLDS
jgi:hypothetical protein